MTDQTGRTFVAGERGTPGRDADNGEEDEPAARTRTAMEGATPLRAIGEAEDIAAAVLYRASPASAYVTGKVLEVNGGLEQPNLDLGLPDL